MLTAAAIGSPRAGGPLDDRDWACEEPAVARAEITMDARDELVVVFGGSSGIGEAVARTMAARESRVIIAGRDPGRLAAAAARLGRAVQTAPGVATGALDFATVGPEYHDSISIPEIAHSTQLHDLQTARELSSATSYRHLTQRSQALLLVMAGHDWFAALRSKRGHGDRRNH